MSAALRASAGCAPADVEAWFAELGLAPLERAEREGLVSWDLLLDGVRRPALRVTVILDPALALIAWAHYAPPIADGFRRSYRLLLRWNDELPFVKFSVGEDERPLLTTELPVAHADRDALGLALARLVAVADRLHDESTPWLEAGGWPVGGGGAHPAGVALLRRYAAELAELAEPLEPAGPAEPVEPTATAQSADPDA
jgi:hypothetical protein